MKPRPLLPLLISLGILLAFPSYAQDATPTPSPSPEPTPSPVLIYDLKLEKTGRSVNYTFFKNGFLVLDPGGSTFTSIVVLTDPNTFNFYQAADFVSGSYSEILDYAGRRNVVLFGSTSGINATTDNAALQVVGPIDRSGKVGGGLRAQYSDKMRGYLLASGPEIEAASTNGTVIGFEYGYAGFSKATAEFNKGLTKEVNGQSLDASGAIDFLEKYLSDRGIPGPTPMPSLTP
jgi:hypothetical protein